MFIRLGGCDVGCVWCDVKDSWDADAHKKFSVEEIVATTNQSPSVLVVITGGEPLMHNLEALTSQLKSAGKKQILKLPELIRSAANGIGFVFHLKNLRSQYQKFIMWQTN